MQLCVNSIPDQLGASENGFMFSALKTVAGCASDFTDSSMDFSGPEQPGNNTGSRDTVQSTAFLSGLAGLLKKFSQLYA